MVAPLGRMSCAPLPNAAYPHLAMASARSGKPIYGTVKHHASIRQFFKYSDSAVKAMGENPQDRSPAVARLFEGFGGKVEVSYWFRGNLEWDGMLIVQIPDEITAQAIALTTRAPGNFTRNASVPLMNAEEFKAAMEKAKSFRSGYTAPTATKQ